MSQENWNLLGDKLRDYRPAVDADAAWQAARDRLAVEQPVFVSLGQLLRWKGVELLVLLLFVQLVQFTPPSPANLPTASGRDTAPAASFPPAGNKESTATKNDILAATPTPVTERAIQPPIPRAKRALTTTTNRSTADESTLSVTPERDRSRVVEKLTQLTKEQETEYQTELAVVSSVSSVPITLLPTRVPGPLVSRKFSKRSVANPTSIVSSATPVVIDVWAAVSRPEQGRVTPLFGLQMRLPAGPRGEMILGAGYQRVTGMDLHWHQAEYHKDFGYPTGNAVERWLDSYGAWEYRIGYRYRLDRRWAVQSDLQLTFLQERGLRERIQGSDVFLGSSRRSLVDRDFGVGLGVDYRLTRHLGLFTRYVFGLGDITPNNLYPDQRTHRHGGVQVGLRLTPFGQ